jgi:hypothetical protein
MRNAILLQQAYRSHQWIGSFIPALEMVKDRHQAYCDRWEIDYLQAIGEVNPKHEPNHGGWAKLDLVEMALDRDYQYVFWIDADAMIVDLNTDLRTGAPEGIGMVMHDGPGTPGPHLNVGVMLMQNTPNVKTLVAEWLSRYPGTQEFPWYEQGEAHKMARDPKWKDTIVQIDNRWNSCLYAKTHVDNAVIEGWHGMGNPEQRTAQMKAYLDILVKQEGKNDRTNSTGTITG